jgi:hypothetical protein
MSQRTNPRSGKVWMVPLAWTGHHDAAVENGLSAIERSLVDQWLEVALGRDAVVRAFNSSDVDRIPHHLAEALWRKAQALSAAESCFGGARDDFLLRVVASREVLECAPHQRSAFRIVNEARLRPLRCVQVTERSRERPPAEFQGCPHPGTRSIRAHVVVELCEGSEHAFHQLAG